MCAGISVVLAGSGVEYVHASLGWVAVIIGTGIPVVTLSIGCTLRLDFGLHLRFHIGPDFRCVLILRKVWHDFFTGHVRVPEILDVSHRKLILADLWRHQILSGITDRQIRTRTGIRGRRAARPQHD
jgi:hypothetical protein